MCGRNVVGAPAALTLEYCKGIICLAMGFTASIGLVYTGDCLRSVYSDKIKREHTSIPSVSGAAVLDPEQYSIVSAATGDELSSSAATPRRVMD